MSTTSTTTTTTTTLPNWVERSYGSDGDHTRLVAAYDVLTDALADSDAHPAPFAEWADDYSSEVDDYFAEAFIVEGEDDDDVRLQLEDLAAYVMSAYEDAYEGEWESAAEWAKAQAISLGDITSDQAHRWPFSSIDWEDAASELEDDGYIFANTAAGTVAVVCIL